CGGCSAVIYMTARSIVCNDAHEHLINMARVLTHRELGPKLYRRLRRIAFHPRELAEAQTLCKNIERPSDLFFDDVRRGDSEPWLAWAEWYFCCVWMAPGGRCGTESEFNQKMSFRWNANGGDSNTRFRSA